MAQQSNISNVGHASATNTGLETALINKLAWNWNVSSTVQLLETWREYYAELKSTKRNSTIYKRMASELSETLGIEPPLTGSHIQAKINNLRKQFRREKRLIGPSGGAPSKWWAYDLVAAIIGGEASLDNELLSQSQDFNSQQFLDSQILIVNDDNHNVEVLNLEESDIADNIHTSSSISTAEPVASTSEETIDRNKRLSSDNVNTSNKKTKTELEDLLEGNGYWRSMKNILSLLKSRNRPITSLSSTDCESSSQPISLLNLVPIKLNFQGKLIERELWSKPKSSQWFDEIFFQMNESDFKEHFRVNLKTFNFLVKELRPHLEKTTTKMREPFSVVKRVAVALHYLGSCEEYRVVSSLFGIGKSTANVIVHEFVNAVNENLLHKYVKFPLSEEKLKECSKDFEAILGFPQCIGAVDGCHVPVSPPKDQALSYYNYKGWYSIVLFAVVDCRYRFIYTSVGSPGRNNDGYILQNSSLKAILDSDLFDKSCRELGGSTVPLCLMGDSAFPLTRHLLKPYPEHVDLNEIQKNYNKVFCGARRVVENAFGRIKARFRIIYKRMECDISFATKIINTCVTLHNICEHYDDTLRLEWLMHRQVNDGPNQPNIISTAGNNGPGKNIRDSIAKYLHEKER